MFSGLGVYVIVVIECMMNVLVEQNEHIPIVMTFSLFGLQSTTSAIPSFLSILKCVKPAAILVLQMYQQEILQQRYVLVD